MNNENIKVFETKITRNNTKYRNDFNEITYIVPANPVPASLSKTFDFCDYKPRSDKYYIPKKRIGLSKVKTVRDVRSEFVKDVYSYLPIELEKQRNYLLRKIRHGSSKTEKTKEIAKNIIKNDSPICKTAWHMLMNINPYEHAYPTQFVLWKGKRIQVNGSKGGAHQYICNYDIGKTSNGPGKKIGSPKNSSLLNKKRSLLDHSLKVEFKPGPLTRKKYLDTSYQRYQFGDMELVNLPKPGLEIRPALNKPLGPSITTFLYQTYIPDFNSVISAKWAEFAVSVLGSNISDRDAQLNENCTISFDLNYKRSQNRLLMRHDSDMIKRKDVINDPLIKNIEEEHSEFEIISEVGNILNEMLRAVDISIRQDQMYTGEDELRDISATDGNSSGNTLFLSKPKKKYNELDRLDVTVIRISENAIDDSSVSCKNDYCKLGCICASLSSSLKTINHCSNIGCMFQCKCGFISYDISDYLKDSNSEITNFVTFDKNSRSKLAKEEQKFHQTVIVTDEKSILLKSRKRDWKTSRKYSEFYSHMKLKPSTDFKKKLLVTVLKLSVTNVEPFCMVHNLYKCFCRGIFTHTHNTDAFEETAPNQPVDNEIIQQNSEKDIFKHHEQEVQSDLSKISLRSRRNRSKDSITVSISNLEKNTAYYTMSDNDTNLDICARLVQFKERKFCNGYYKDMHNKIKALERNDKRLQSKLLSIMGNCEWIEKDESRDFIERSHPVPELKDLLTTFAEGKLQSSPTAPVMVKTISKDVNSKSFSYKVKLVSWLEHNYKQYRMRIDQGIVQKSLDPPKPGTLVLHPWDFILTRYRERKNYFLTSKQKPFRIFLAIDIKNSFFDNCVNISDIPWSDLNKYPITVKNLLTNATDLLDNFCILYGLTNCWELIGSVTKVHENRNNKLQDLKSNEDEIDLSNENESENRSGNSQWLPDISKTNSNITIETITEKSIKKSDTVTVDHNINTKTTAAHNNKCNIKNMKSIEKTANANITEVLKEKCNTKSEEVPKNESSTAKEVKSDFSKWFLMNIENDFTEIQFYVKGFFVNYSSLMNAINVARVTNKTVRLSSQKCVTQQEPQFGIYAIPIKNKCCVFIGPYEKNELLGIETVKRAVQVKRNRTRGIWITTNKIDNMNVVDDPLSFIPSTDTNADEVVHLINDTNLSENDDIISPSSLSNNTLKRKLPEAFKVIKPIKISKTNEFYELDPNGLLQQISPTKLQNSNNESITSTPSRKSLLRNAGESQKVLKVTSAPPIRPLFNNATRSDNDSSCELVKKKPIAEISPQIKQTTTVKSMNNDSATPKHERSMFVLKPEEINKRLMENKMLNEPVKSENPMKIGVDSRIDMSNEINMDIENFLATSVEQSLPTYDVHVISDDEEREHSKPEKNYEDVYIVCTNKDIGWIPGKLKCGLVSFEFPGFKETDYYEPSKAIQKINQVLSRKVFVPKSVIPKWRICRKDQLKTITKPKLQVKDLHSDYVLTTTGLKHKSTLLNFGNFLREHKKQKSLKAVSTENVTHQKPKVIKDLEEKSAALEIESDELWCNAIKIKNVISQSLANATDEMREDFSNQLTDILNQSESIEGTGQITNKLAQECSRQLNNVIYVTQDNNMLEKSEESQEGQMPDIVIEIDENILQCTNDLDKELSVSVTYDVCEEPGTEKFVLLDEVEQDMNEYTNVIIETQNTENEFGSTLVSMEECSKELEISINESQDSSDDEWEID